MRLFGKYTFEHLRDCLQGVFEFYKTGDVYILELWQLRFVIAPKSYIEIFLNAGPNQGYISFGKVELHQ